MSTRRSKIRVLGVDPGSRATGWGVVELIGSRLHGVDAGVIRASGTLPLATRLKIVHDGLRGVLDLHAPGVVAVEEIFHAKFARSALALGHVRGVVLLAAESAGVSVLGYPPAVVKRTVAGRGAAAKSQVAALVGALLGWRTVPSLDATDALAIAITGAQAVRSARVGIRETGRSAGAKSAPSADLRDLSL